MARPAAMSRPCPTSRASRARSCPTSTTWCSRRTVAKTPSASSRRRMGRVSPRCPWARGRTASRTIPGVVVCSPRTSEIRQSETPVRCPSSTSRRRPASPTFPSAGGRGGRCSIRRPACSTSTSPSRRRSSSSRRVTRSGSNGSSRSRARARTGSTSTSRRDGFSAPATGCGSSWCMRIRATSWAKSRSGACRTSSSSTRLGGGCTSPLATPGSSRCSIPRPCAVARRCGPRRAPTPWRSTPRRTSSTPSCRTHTARPSISTLSEEIDMTNPARLDIIASFLKLGATSYGGPAIMGVMQAELQQKRQWVSKERFIEGLSIVNMLPGATATQLAIFLGYARGGLWGGLLAGLCFVLPAFFVMLALTVAYAAFGVSPVIQGALYGLGPVVLAIFALAVYRLGRSAASSVSQAIIAVLAAAASIATPLGIAGILVLAGGAGVLLFHSRRAGAILAVAAVSVLAVIPAAVWVMSGPVAVVAGSVPNRESLFDIGTYFFKVGAFTVGGGLTMIAFIQDQVVGQYHWLTPREFIDGLALGQFTPGPVLMVAAYVGYKVGGLSGAAVAAAAAFLPSFVLMLA